MKKIIMLYIFILLTVCSNINSQSDTLVRKRKFMEIAEPGSTVDWLKIRDDIRITHNDFFKNHKEALNLKNDDDFVFKKENKSKDGSSHFKYQQMYKGIKVQGGEYILHEKDGRMFLSNGKLATGLNIDVKPTLPESVAFAEAKKNINALQYSWEDKTNNTVTIPKAELVIVRNSYNKQILPEDYVLAYKFRISSIIPISSYDVFINAHNGKFVKKISRINEHCENGSFTSLYNGDHVISTWKESNNNYILKDECRKIYLTSNSGNTKLSYSKSDNNWGTYYRNYSSLLWAAEMAYDFFKLTPGIQRNSFDNAGAEIKIEEVVGLYNNAFWDPDDQYFGFAFSGSLISGPMVSLDIVGHEFSHAVGDFEANLTYELESGALDEGFADIFGLMVESYGGQYDGNYLCAEKMWIPDGKLRDMIDPHSKGDPAAYGDLYWINTDGCIPTDNNDKCGVHTNSGVINHWFYLLCEGGQGVTAIGKTMSALIVYDILTNYLTSTSDYNDAMWASISAAANEYGDCSNELKQVVNAWIAVGLTPHVGGSTVTVNCTELNQYHNNNQVYGKSTLMNLTSNCNISSNGTLVFFYSPTEVRLTNGFHSGNNFRAYICNNGILKSTFIDEPTINQQDLNNANLGLSNNEIESIEKEITIDVSPNPSNGIFDINVLNTDEKVEVKIFNLYGNQIYLENNLNSGRIKIDISSQPSGIYFLNVIINSNTYTYKIIKQ